MAAISTLAELVAGLEKEAAVLEQALQGRDDARVRDVAAQTVGRLRTMRSQAAMAVAQAATGVGPAPLLGSLGYGENVPATIAGISAAPPVAKQLPTGPAESFDRDNLNSVVQHMSVYEASEIECAKALRAMASLAYANASKVGDHPEALNQALRLLSLHPSSDQVQSNGIRSLCNMAYDANVALNRLSARPVIGAFIMPMTTSKAKAFTNKEIGPKASEAVARVVSAEVGPERPEGAPTVPAERGPLTSLFTVIEPSNAEGREVVVELVKQLVNNEVATTELLAARLIALADTAMQSGESAAAWLLLAKQLAMAEIANLSELLITQQAIPAAAKVMGSQLAHAPAQLAGIEAMSGLVGSRWIGLQGFAAVKGIERIEQAMGNHPSEAVLQTKGIRALASGIQWPEDIQTKANYNFRNGVTLTKAAMSKHGEIEELQVAGLEALQKYLDKVKCMEEVKADGGTGLIKAVMARHGNVEKVKTVGAAVLDALGEKDWKPKGQAA